MFVMFRCVFLSKILTLSIFYCSSVLQTSESIFIVVVGYSFMDFEMNATSSRSSRTQYRCMFMISLLFYDSINCRIHSMYGADIPHQNPQNLILWGILCNHFVAYDRDGCKWRFKFVWDKLLIFTVVFVVG